MVDYIEIAREKMDCTGKKNAPFQLKVWKGADINISFLRPTPIEIQGKGNGLFHNYLYGTLCHSNEVRTGNKLLAVRCTTDI